MSKWQPAWAKGTDNWSAPDTALQPMVNTPSASDTLTSCGGAGDPYATFVTLITTAARRVPPFFRSRDSTISVYEDVVS